MSDNIEQMAWKLVEENPLFKHAKPYLKYLAMKELEYKIRKAVWELKDLLRQ
ncbi:MAG: hypothetical protein WAN47_05850 [Nitrosotalea sp.]